MIENLPWMPIWVKDLLTDAFFVRLSLEEKGLYLLMLFRQWIDGSLPRSPADLSKIFGEDPRKIRRILPRLLSKFSVRSSGDDRMINPRCEEVRAAQIQLLERKTNAGRRGAAGRWGDATASQAHDDPSMRPQWQSNSNTKPNNTSPITTPPIVLARNEGEGSSAPPDGVAAVEEDGIGHGKKNPMSLLHLEVRPPPGADLGGEREMDPRVVLAGGAPPVSTPYNATAHLPQGSGSAPDLLGDPAAPQKATQSQPGPPPKPNSTAAFYADLLAAAREAWGISLRTATPGQGRLIAEEGKRLGLSRQDQRRLWGEFLRRERGNQFAMRKPWVAFLDALPVLAAGRAGERANGTANRNERPGICPSLGGRPSEEEIAAGNARWAAANEPLDF